MKCNNDKKFRNLNDLEAMYQKRVNKVKKYHNIKY